METNVPWARADLRGLDPTLKSRNTPGVADSLSLLRAQDSGGFDRALNRARKRAQTAQAKLAAQLQGTPMSLPAASIDTSSGAKCAESPQHGFVYSPAIDLQNYWAASL